MSLQNSYYWNADYPKMRIDVSYSQTARTGTSATYRVNMAVYFTSSGWHGYGLSAKCTINGTSQQLRIKEPSNSWDGAGHKGTWTFNITASAGASGGTLPASIQMWGTEGDTTNINSGNKTVSLSTWNTAPTWTSDDANINGWKENKIIPENTGAVTVNLPSASDKEGNTIKYDVYRYVNGASNSKIATGITSRTVSDNISSFGQGSQIKYLIKCNDGSLWASEDRWTWTYTKNKFTPASISTSSSIGYNTTSISLNVSGASNTNGDTTFKYRLTNTSGLTIHNGDFTPASGKVTFSIYGGSGTRPSTPHIDFADLKSYTARGTYQGTLVLRLTTSNAYGSSDYREVSIPIDLRIAPVPATLANPTGAITVAGSSYFVFNRSTVGVSWSGATDKLGAGALSYELYYRYGSGSWNRLVSTSGTSWSGTLPQVTSATTCSFKVVATTTYGYSATSAEKSITMHYYNKPKVSYSAPNRTTSEFSVVIASATDTSITSVAISSRSFVGLSGKSTTFSGANTTIKDTGLSGDSNYTLVVTVTDNSGLSGSTTTLEVPVTAYIPIMSITDKGIAINTTADPAYKLTIGGALRVNDTICSTTGRFNHGNNTILRSNNNSTIVSCINGIMYFRPNGDTNSTNQVTISTAGLLNAPNVQVNGNNVYHTGRKPTAADVGALPLTGGTLTGKLSVEGIKLRDKAGLDCNTYKTDEFWVNRTGNTSPNRPEDWCTVFNIGADYNANLQLAHSYAGAPNFWVRGRHDTSGNYQSWAKVYTTLNKPTPEDVGLPLTTISKTLTIGTSWTNTGIVKSNLQSGSYMVQIHNNEPNNGIYGERWTGVMSWYDGGTNSNEVDEISLHCAGHANNGRHIYLRTVRTPGGGGLRLEIACNYNLFSSTYDFSFRKLI